MISPLSDTVESCDGLVPPVPGLDLTICILNWNGVKSLVDCLEALAAIRRMNEIQYEIIVVDNGSNDGSVATVRARFPDVEVIANSENLGFAAGNNQAIRKGSGRNFLILNNDTVPLNTCLTRMVRFLDQNPEVGIVGGRLINPDGSTQFTYYPPRLPSLRSSATDLLWIDRIWPRNPWGRFAPTDSFDWEKPSLTTQISGACLMIRREVLNQIGLFDEDFEYWYEDVDLCCRCLQAEWKIAYLPDAKIIHHGGATFSRLDFSEKSSLRFRSLLRYFQKHFSRRQVAALRILMGAVLLLRMPLLVGLLLSPRAAVRRRFRGGMHAYFRILREIVGFPARGARSLSASQTCGKIKRRIAKTDSVSRP